jgi:hypothetical protein
MTSLDNLCLVYLLHHSFSHLPDLPKPFINKIYRQLALFINCRQEHELNIVDVRKTWAWVGTFSNKRRGMFLMSRDGTHSQ